MSSLVDSLHSRTKLSRHVCSKVLSQRNFSLEDSIRHLASPPPLSEDELSFVVPRISFNHADLRIIRSSLYATVTHHVAHIRLSFSFSNVSNQSLESILSLCYEDATLTGFSIDIDGIISRSTCMKNKDADAEYDDHIASGNSVFKVSSSSSKRDSFDISLGNIKSSCSGKVNLTFMVPLRSYKNTLTLSLPVIDADVVAAFTQNMTISITMNRPIKAINPYAYLDLYDIHIQDRVSTVKINSNNIKGHFIQFDIELEELMSMELSHTPSNADYTIETFEDDELALSTDGALSISFFPDVSDAISDFESEIIFIVDRSGSMSGSRMTSAKDALQLFLRSLPPMTYFNIISFGSTYSCLFESSQLYYDQTLSVATTHVNNMDSNMGGTEIYRPLAYVLSEAPTEGRPRQVFLITDGEDYEQSKIFSLIKSKIGEETRIFTFGIGADSSVSLVKGIAQFGNGDYQFVSSIGSIGSIESSVMDMLASAMEPIITHVTIDWGDVQLSQRPVPVQIPSIFSGRSANVFVLLGKGNKGTKIVTLHGRIGDENVSYPCEIDFDKNICKGSVIHKLAASSIAKDCEVEDVKSFKQDIIDIGLKYAIITKYTSLLAIKENSGQVSESMKKVHVDLNAFDQNYWDDASESDGSSDYEDEWDEVPNTSYDDYLFEGEKGGVYDDPYASDTFQLSDCLSSRLSFNKVKSGGKTYSSKKEQEPIVSYKEEDPSPVTVSSSSPIVKLISFMDASGKAKLDMDLANALNKYLKSMEASVPNEMKGMSEIWATLLIIATLELKYMNKINEWKMASAKSIKLIKREFQKKSIDYATMIQRAKEYLS